MSQFPKVLEPQEADIAKMLACHVHIGTRNLDLSMEQYIWKRRADGIYIIDLKKTWEKLLLAARMIVTVDNPADVVLISARPYGQRAILKFAKFTGANALAGRYTPGTFTNQIQKAYVEPRVLVVNDPRTDHQPLRESSYVNLPAIAFAHTDANVRYVDCAIPANNKGKNAIGLMYWLLAREVLYLRGSADCNRQRPWNVMVDLFIYRDPEEVKDEEAAADGYAGEFTNANAGGEAEFAHEEHDTYTHTADWADSAQPAAVAAAGATNWDSSVMTEVRDWSADAM